MEIVVRNCCHSSDAKPRFRALAGDRILIKLAGGELRLATIVGFTADGEINAKRDDLPHELNTIDGQSIIALFLEE